MMETEGGLVAKGLVLALRNEKEDRQTDRDRQTGRHRPVGGKAKGEPVPEGLVLDVARLGQAAVDVHGDAAHAAQLLPVVHKVHPRDRVADHRRRQVLSEREERERGEGGGEVRGRCRAARAPGANRVCARTR